MCEVCRFTESGDIPDDRSEFINYRVGVIAGKAVYLTGMICDVPEQPNLEISVDVGGSEFISYTAGINYCPLCGRKLSKY